MYEDEYKRWLLCAFFCVIPRRLNFMCRRLGTLWLFHLHRWIGIPIRLRRWNSVPKRRHIKFKRRVITQKKAYNIQNNAKVWNQEKEGEFACIGAAVDVLRNLAFASLTTRTHWAFSRRVIPRLVSVVFVYKSILKMKATLSNWTVVEH